MKIDYMLVYLIPKKKRLDKDNTIKNELLYIHNSQDIEAN